MRSRILPATEVSALRSPRSSFSSSAYVGSASAFASRCRVYAATLSAKPGGTRTPASAREPSISPSEAFLPPTSAMRSSESSSSGSAYFIGSPIVADLARAGDTARGVGARVLWRVQRAPEPPRPVSPGPATDAAEHVEPDPRQRVKAHAQDDEPAPQNPSGDVGRRDHDPHRSGEGDRVPVRHSAVGE